MGQPRDGDPRAAWLELDVERGELRGHRVTYDVERAVAGILEAGLPEFTAERLRDGV